MKKIFLIFLCIGNLYAQEAPSTIMTLGEFLGYVKTFHPIAKQANLIVNESDAKLMKARGAFDPKIEVDYAKKEFKEKEYYNKLNTTFKIPVWYGIDIKANFEDNSGLFLNAENNLPNNGLYSAGVSLSLGEGLLLNKRMALLKQAKNFQKQAEAEQKLAVNSIVYKATIAYFNWLRFFNEKEVYKNFVGNAQMRFEGIKRSHMTGDKPAIDTLEAKITLNNRKLNYEKAKIKFLKSSLELSNFLWLKDNTPVELQEDIHPDKSTLENVDAYLNTSLFDIENYILETHPKLQSLQYKIDNLSIEKRLKKNNLLPKLDVEYNFLSQNADQFNTFRTDNYKAGVKFKLPILLRKERGDLKLAKLKLQATTYDRLTVKLSLKNKINAILQELESFEIQNTITNTIVEDYAKLVAAEERKFFLGESSLFLVNSRESKFIDVQLKAIQLQNSFLNSKARLFNVLVIE